MCSKKEELNDFLNDFNMKLASVTFEFKYSKEKIDSLDKLLYQDNEWWPSDDTKSWLIIKINCT